MTDTVIWDFNGTLYDDVMTGIKSVNTLLSRRGLKTLSDVDEYRSVFRFPVIDYYRDVGFDIDGEGFEPIAHEWVAEYLENEKTAGLYPHAADTLAELRRHGIYQALLSATEINMLKSQLSRLGTADAFDDVIGTGDIYAYSKVDAAKIWACGRDLSHAVMIGDTAHDEETAAALDVPFFGVSWGHGRRDGFGDGVTVFDSFNEIIKYITDNNN